jgi:hypothetical protein
MQVDKPPDALPVNRHKPNGSEESDLGKLVTVTSSCVTPWTLFEQNTRVLTCDTCSLHTGPNHGINYTINHSIDPNMFLGALTESNRLMAMAFQGQQKVLENVEKTQSLLIEQAKDTKVYLTRMVERQEKIDKRHDATMVALAQITAMVVDGGGGRRRGPIASSIAALLPSHILKTQGLLANLPTHDAGATSPPATPTSSGEGGRKRSNTQRNIDDHDIDDDEALCNPKPKHKPGPIPVGGSSKRQCAEWEPLHCQEDDLRLVYTPGMLLLYVVCAWT